MKRMLSAAAFAAALAVTAAPTMAANVGISINLGEPGFYGQINLGDAPSPPVLVNTQPIVIQRGPDFAAGPIYLHVPVAEQRHWRRYCLRYAACGRPVYFVRDDWYQRQYVPHYHQLHGRPGPARREDRDHRPGPGPDQH